MQSLHNVRYIDCLRSTCFHYAGTSPVRAVVLQIRSVFIPFGVIRSVEIFSMNRLV